MPSGLKRYQTMGHDHLITISCYERRPYFRTPESRNIFERSLEQTRRNYELEVIAYVVMPEHVHLLLSEPKQKPLKSAIQALKLSVSKKSEQKPFWQDSYHDFNVFTTKKLNEKRRYIHRNPVARGLVLGPEGWPHSSYLAYLNRAQRTVHISALDPVITVGAPSSTRSG